MFQCLSKQLGEQLQSRAWRLALAESCTGGGLAAAVTAVAGSSAWFDRGFVTYQGAAKVECLGVRPDTLAQHGEVSAATAAEMATGALRHSQAHLALSITGIAGPSGGSEQKPVGTVFFGLAQQSGSVQWCHQQFSGDREQVRDSAIEFALSWLIESLKRQS